MIRCEASGSVHVFLEVSCMSHWWPNFILAYMHPGTLCPTSDICIYFKRYWSKYIMNHKSLSKHEPDVKVTIILFLTAL
jgi:hypothetical protein